MDIEPFEALKRSRIALLSQITLSTKHPQSGVTIDHDAFYGSQGIDLPWFNTCRAIRMKDEDADRRITRIVNWFDEKQVSFEFWVDSKASPLDLALRLPRLGFTKLERRPTGMHMSLQNFQCEPIPANIKIQRVRDVETFRIYCSILQRAFSADQAFFDLLFRFQAAGFSDSCSLWHYLASVDDAPAATAMGLRVGNKILGVFNISVLQDFRRLGVGKVLSNHIISEGKESGCEVAVLEATPMAVPLYKSLGFNVIDEFEVYVHKFEPKK